MSRALRRHPVAQPKQGRQAKPPAVRPGRRTAKTPREAHQGGRGLRSLLQPSWLMDIVNELRKVTWPTREDTWYLTLVVLVVAITFGVFLAGVDMFFNWAIDRTIIP